MAIVDGLTKARMLAIEGASVVSGAVDSGTGHLILTTHDGTTMDAGYVWGVISSATDTVAGIVELATNIETSAGTDATRAVTPAGLAVVISSFQPLDSDLTTIAGLTPIDNNVLQRKSGAWTSRTATQLKTDLALVITDVAPSLGSNGTYLRSNGSAVTWSLVAFADLATTLQNTINQKTNGFTYSGSAYVAATTSPGVYVGPTDPGTVPDGSVWYQTAT